MKQKEQFTTEEQGLIELALEETISVLRNRFEEEAGYIHPAKKYEELYDRITSNERSCRVCGCTEDDCSQCIEKTGEPCSWVEDDLCSACESTDIFVNKNPPKDCSCMATVSEKIKTHIISDQAKKQKEYKLVSGDWENATFYPKVRPYSNFIIKSTFQKKDGTTSKPVNSHVGIHYTFCPFYGEKYPVNKITG